MKYLPNEEAVNAFIFKHCTVKPKLSSKEQANARLRYAVWSGKIKKPIICSSCNETAKRICGHHHNGYAKEKALDVVWLCDKCHAIAHSSRIGSSI